ncbi:hypothetical protein EJ05DRAFT_241589 [Pseudovirgaria hyperparasitica]|uniref:Uncharacterized protein n=1 Tax=Pseudovirgaria hyperparasitica TaxID=470096 RepID=A0A6A6WFI4_9PEZI|nr:uncharacterized protein EJ05DRAFT_241589 [Pseudovirgaria hyperparasitica]KAF2760760.1 hypothetical protein EJ05DRAFT_241589 [Pseudovirgaria hyperparasitica]
MPVQQTSTHANHQPCPAHKTSDEPSVTQTHEPQNGSADKETLQQQHIISSSPRQATDSMSPQATPDPSTPQPYTIIAHHLATRLTLRAPAHVRSTHGQFAASAGGRVWPTAHIDLPIRPHAILRPAQPRLRSVAQTQHHRERPCGVDVGESRGDADVPWP